MVDKEPIGNIKPVEKKSNRPMLFIALGIVVILLGVKVFLDYREKQDLQAFYQEEMAAAQVKLDDINEELTYKIAQIDSLGGNIDDLVKAQEQVTEERDQLQRTRTANRQLISKLRRKTDV